MKKIILKYLPIGIALLLVGACLLTLNIYKNNFAEFAVFSWSGDKYSFDMKISPSGKILTVEGLNRASYEELDAAEAVVGMDVAKAAAYLEANFEDGTVFVTVVAAEKTETDQEILKQLAYRASDAVTKSHVVAYGNYTEIHVNRTNTFEMSLGRISTVSDFADLCTKKIENCYLDVYSACPAPIDNFVYYVNNVRSEHLSEEDGALIKIDTSRASYDLKFISKEDAKKIIIEGSDLWYGEDVGDFEYHGISFSFGQLRYKFATSYYGYESYVYVDMMNGTVYFDEEG